MVVPTDLHLLAGLANGLELLLGVESDVDIAVGQGGRRAGIGVGDHNIIVAMGGACADARRCTARARGDAG